MIGEDAKQFTNRSEVPGATIGVASRVLAPGFADVAARPPSAEAVVASKAIGVGIESLRAGRVHLAIPEWAMNELAAAGYAVGGAVDWTTVSTYLGAGEGLSRFVALTRECGSRD